MKKKKDAATELEFLRYFFSNISPVLGPADDDIIGQIKEDFMVETGKLLPKGY